MRKPMFIFVSSFFMWLVALKNSIIVGLPISKTNKLRDEDGNLVVCNYTINDELHVFDSTLYIFGSNVTLRSEHIWLCEYGITRLTIIGTIIDIEDEAFFAAHDISELVLKANLTRLKRSYFQDLRKLTSLTLHVSSLEEIEAGTFINHNITHLVMDSASVKYLKAGVFSELAKIEELHLSGNFSALPKNTFNDTPTMKKLSVTNSLITQFNSEFLFNNMTLLDHLDLSSNKLESLSDKPFDKLSTLKILRTSKNIISNLGNDLFCTNRKLEHVDLSNNRIAYLTADTFCRKPIESIRSVDLSFNYLHTLSMRIFLRMRSLKSVIIVGNRLKCQCMDMLQLFFLEMEITEVSCDGFNDGQHPICVMPRVGDESCFPRMNHDTEYVESYRSNLNVSECGSYYSI